MGKISNKNLIKLNKIIEPQKKKFGFEPNLFSYKFDYRTKKLTINYSLPYAKLDMKSGEVVWRRERQTPIYDKDIDESNFEKHFLPATRSVFADHIKLIRSRVAKAESSSIENKGLETFRHWVGEFYNRDSKLDEKTIRHKQQ